MQLFRFLIQLLQGRGTTGTLGVPKVNHQQLPLRPLLSQFPEGDGSISRDIDTLKVKERAGCHDGVEYQ
jgi:hypothetical protein